MRAPFYMSTAFEQHNRTTQEPLRASIFQRHRRMRNRNERSSQWFQINRNDELRNLDADENSISFDNNVDHFPIRLSALRAIVVDSNGSNNNGINIFDHYYMRNALRSLDHDYITSTFERYPVRRRNYLSGSVIPFNREGSSHYLEEVLHFLENTFIHPLTWDQINSQDIPPDNYVKIEYTSWLKSGSIFQGVQTFSDQASVFLSESSSKNEKKIKVVIQDISFSEMSLSGQIEVFNPSDNGSNGSIMIWWDGEIVDFIGYYNLLAVKRGIAWKTDVSCWRKLEPFKGMDDYEYVGLLVFSVIIDCFSRFLNLLFTKEKISDICSKYIFMRWKESEFIGSSIFENELATSGSYFCCLRRNDGFIEGYYFDPSVSCQHINLYPKMDDGVFKFR
ncbi:uncharacterized protein T551_00250 [Pneumocystis jirovecii RU7]|uniref:Uncharacterized protein n=1 Tax=Pneumocystis jirovecii (strain RU7) TaxID=1408657 RepID=A0A0W4ZWL5_PNEJ7|nr:uncharacterized protein T551_00250 [Pneumocystis jirovecii RU7]KTW32765.1 hypothetical protein T551_00250 [Pneumocystis jirovecii RU7]